MNYLNGICADAGSSNCPCPLAETGGCLVCSRLAGEQACDCKWCGLCIYNEFMQNDRKAKNLRNSFKAHIVRKVWYGEDLLRLVVEVDKGFALRAARPGTFVFLKGKEAEYYDVPISVMKADVQNCRLHFAVRIISAKTKAIAEATEYVHIRGIYRNGFLTGIQDYRSEKGRWLIMTRGVGLAPAVNLIGAAQDKIRAGEIEAEVIVDTEKITADFLKDGCELAGISEKQIKKSPFDDICPVPGGIMVYDRVYCTDDYDIIFILASDYYIRLLAKRLEAPVSKLVVANNYHMCCGEGICGACNHVDENGKTHKMCKCRQKE